MVLPVPLVEMPLRCYLQWFDRNAFAWIVAWIAIMALLWLIDILENALRGSLHG